MDARTASTDCSCFCPGAAPRTPAARDRQRPLPRPGHVAESGAQPWPRTRPADARGACCSNLKRLEFLEVCGGSVTDAGVAHIAPLGRLTHLSLAQNARITDVSTPVLAQLFELVYLNLTRSRLSSTGVQRLHPLTVPPSSKHDCCGPWHAGLV